jgi:arylsulfatase A-like enzyme
MARRRSSESSETDQATGDASLSPQSEQTSSLPDERPQTPSADDQPKKEWAKDPHNYASINVGRTNEGPHVVLLRSHRYKQMQLSFDEKPPSEVLDKLRDAGWKWHVQDKVWTLPVERGNEWRAAQDAERMLKEVGNLIRQKNGLEPAEMPYL